MSTKKARQRYLFNLYARNFSFHEPSHEEIFVCPLCFRGFSEEAIDADLLSIEHIVPSSVGGTLETLTCKECNNKTGSSLDAHLQRRISSEDTIRGLTEEILRGTVKIGEGQFTADIKLSQERVEIAAIPSYSNPSGLDKAIMEIETGASSMNLKVNLGFTRTASSAAIVRSAYLTMFHHFGYGYIKFDCLDRLRYFILNPHDDPTLSQLVITLPSVPLKPIFVSVLHRPQELQCFFVALDLSSKVERFLGVMLPGLHEQSNRLYDLGNQMNIANTECDFVHVEFRDQLLENPSLKDYALYVWHKATS